MTLRIKTLDTVMLTIVYTPIMLNTSMLSVVMLSVVAPICLHKHGHPQQTSNRVATWLKKLVEYFCLCIPRCHRHLSYID